MAPSITIGIPTFNRREAVLSSVQSLLSERLVDQDGVEVLVIDNASQDGTYAALCSIADGRQVRVLQNAENIGVKRNIVRLFSEARTDYVLVTSDEDPVISANIAPLRAFLARFQPRLVSPQFYRRGVLYRGRRKSRPVRASEWSQAACFASGVVFERKASEVASAELAEFVNHPEQLYFQSLLAARFMLENGCYWWNQQATEKRFALPTQIFDARNGSYKTLPSRWYQHLETDRFLTYLLGTTKTDRERSIALEMQSAHRRGLIQTIRHAINHETPDLVAEFDAGVRRYPAAQGFFSKALHRLRRLAG